MARWYIESDQGVDMGTFEAETREQAYAAMMSDAGADPADYPGGMDDLIFKEIDYTFTLFDADPGSATGDVAWPQRTAVPIEAASLEDAEREVRSILERETQDLHASDGYQVGQRIFAVIDTPDGQLTLSHELTSVAS